MRPLDATYGLSVDGLMLFVESIADPDEEGKYYVLVGIFDEEGSFSFGDDGSEYYNTPKITDDPETLLPAIIEYMNSQE